MATPKEEFQKLAKLHHFTHASMAEATIFITKNCPELAEIENDPLNLMPTILLIKAKLGENISDQSEHTQTILKEAAAMLVRRPKEKSLPNTKVSKNGVKQIFYINPSCNTPDEPCCET